MRHFDENNYLIQEGSANTCLVSGDDAGGAGALVEGVIEIAVGARVHGFD